ncbi:MAG TPA: hypothetical protein VF826_14035 [Chloroflexia bacterium]|jgi:hypothetical protein
MRELQQTAPGGSIGSARVATPKVRQEKPSSLRATLTRVAWLAILLGLVVEVLLVASRMGALPFEAAVAELVNRVSWSVIVCVGLALGDTLAEDKPLWLGLSGLATAPLAFTIARGLHKGTSELLEAKAPLESIAPLLAGSIRGLEYMCLGLAIFWLSRRVRASAPVYIGTGLLIGLVFGLVMLALNPAVMSSMATMLVWSVNELLFPVGCALVLFASEALGDKLKK